MIEELLKLGLLFLLFAGVLIPLEHLYPLREEKPVLRKGLAVDLLHFFVNPFLVYAALATFLALLSVVLIQFVPLAIREAVASQPYWLQLVEVFLLVEISAYLSHRLCHEVPFLWRFHSIHHTQDELDWLAAYHQHPVDIFITAGLAHIPIAILGFSPEAFVSLILFQKIYVGFLHANVDIDYGWLNRIIASPRFHHWHHADERIVYDQNYSATLSLLDVLFGSFHLPGEKFPEKYGASDSVPKSYLGQLLYPFRFFRGGSINKKGVENTCSKLIGNSSLRVSERMTSTYIFCKLWKEKIATEKFRD